MKRTQKTRRALVASVVSMAMCCALLLGTTFAWFTDSVTNTGNVITAGNLKIDATAYDLGAGGRSVTIPGVNNGTAFSFEDNGLDLKSDAAKTNPIISETLWEPGKSDAKLLEIKNSGDLATNIRLDFDVTDDGLQDALWFDFVQVSPQQGQFAKRDMSDLRTLAQSMVFTLEQNESMSFVLVYGMKEEAGNEYQGKTFSASVTVMATQAPVETDGFGNNQYDAQANGEPDHPEWATGGTTQVTKPSDGWADTTTLAVPGVNISIPKAAIDEQTATLKLTVLDKGHQSDDGSVAVDTEQAVNYYNIDLAGLAPENVEKIPVSLQVGKGLSGVMLYFNGQQVEDIDYNSDTGVLTFKAESFGTFAVVYNMPWDGTQDLEGLTVNTNDEEKRVMINTAAQLAAFAQQVKEGKTYSGYTVTLTRDLDLSGANWPSIGTANRRFQGTFDGGGHTIVGMHAVNQVGYGNAFFADISGNAVIKNVVFDDAYVSYYPSAISSVTGNVYGIVCGYAYGNVTFDNVHVKNSEIRGYGKIGTILGMAAEPGSTVTKLQNCTVEDVVVTAVYNAGGLIGLAQNQVELNGCATKNVTGNLIDNTSKYVEINTQATKYVNGQSTGDTVQVIGKYWEYPYQDMIFYYAAWGDYYTDYHYAGNDIMDWRLTSLGEQSYVADGLCHNK